MEITNLTNRLDIKIISWNVHGMRKLAILKQVLDRIKYLKSKIIFLQESHLVASDMHYLSK